MLLYITSGSFYLVPESVTNRLSPSKRSYPLRTDWSRTRHREIIHLCDNTVLHFPQPVKSQSAGKVQECVFVDTVGVLGASRRVKTSSSSSCKRPGWETGLWEETNGGLMEDKALPAQHINITAVGGDTRGHRGQMRSERRIWTRAVQNYTKLQQD